jgi:hypothetical protein
VPLHLREHLQNLPTGGGHAPVNAEFQGIDVAVDGAGHRAEPGGDIRPVADRLGGHEVENFTDALGRRCDHVQVAQVQVRREALDLERQGGPQIGLGDAVDVVDDERRVEGGDDLRGFGDIAFVAGRGEVTEATITLGAADVGADRGVEVDEGVNPVFGDEVDGGSRARRCAGSGRLLRVNHVPSLEHAPNPSFSRHE